MTCCPNFWGHLFSPYVAAAFEHEFEAEAKAATNGFSIDAPSLKGNTGVAEIGLSFKPSSTLSLSVDLGLQGYVGKRGGATGSLRAKYAL